MLMHACDKIKAIGSYIKCVYKDRVYAITLCGSLGDEVCSALLLMV